MSATMSAVVQSRPIEDRAGDHLQQAELAPELDSLGRIVGSVVHDFNNLLTGILLYAELLSNELDSGTPPHRHVSQIRKAAESGAVLTRQLLAVARHQVVEAVELSWNQAISEMHDLLARLAGENIELVLELTRNLPRVRISPVHMQRILLNLVLNARDAMPDGGRITVQTRNCTSADTGHGRQVELVVSDNGPGIKRPNAARLLEPFQTTKKDGTGHGWGLFTVRSIVQQHGGDLQVESEPQKGTRVVIWLPRAGPSKTPKSVRR
jgi:two-component system, cell cycle sensor histidine kinase and response regulator CckA